MSRSLDDVAMQVSSALMLAGKNLGDLLGNNGQIIVKRDVVVRYKALMEDAAKVIDKLGMATEDEKRR